MSFESKLRKAIKAIKGSDKPRSERETIQENISVGKETKTLGNGGTYEKDIKEVRDTNRKNADIAITKAIITEFTERASSLQKKHSKNPEKLKQELAKEFLVVAAIRNEFLPPVEGFPVPLMDLSILKLDLSGTELRNINLSNFDLSGFNFSRIRLSEANFTNSNLSGANFQGAGLRSANLQNTNVSKSNFENSDLFGANFSGATFSEDTNITGSVVIAAIFRDAKGLTIEHLQSVKDKDLGQVNLENTGISAENLNGAKVAYRAPSVKKTMDIEAVKNNPANFSWVGVNMSGQNLEGINLAGLDLSGANFTGADLSGANLTGAKVKGTNFAYAILLDAALENLIEENESQFKDSILEIDQVLPKWKRIEEEGKAEEEKYKNLKPYADVLITSENLRKNDFKTKSSSSRSSGTMPTMELDELKIPDGIKATLAATHTTSQPNTPNKLEKRKSAASEEESPSASIVETGSRVSLKKWRASRKSRRESVNPDLPISSPTLVSSSYGRVVAPQPSPEAVSINNSEEKKSEEALAEHIAQPQDLSDFSSSHSADVSDIESSESSERSVSPVVVSNEVPKAAGFKRPPLQRKPGSIGFADLPLSPETPRPSTPTMPLPKTPGRTDSPIPTPPRKALPPVPVNVAEPKTPEKPVELWGTESMRANRLLNLTQLSGAQIPFVLPSSPIDLNGHEEELNRLLPGASKQSETQENPELDAILGEIKQEKSKKPVLERKDTVDDLIKHLSSEKRTPAPAPSKPVPKIPTRTSTKPEANPANRTQDTPLPKGKFVDMVGGAPKKTPPATPPRPKAQPKGSHVEVVSGSVNQIQ